MIRVERARPPIKFTRRVVLPAQRWIKTTAKEFPDEGWSWDEPPPHGRSKDLPAYWTTANVADDPRANRATCLDELYTRYEYRCAYTTLFTYRSDQSNTVDHFRPKSKSPVKMAYDWSNYRLACRAANTNKSDHEDVIDPFDVPDDLFELNLLNGRVRVNSTGYPHSSEWHQRAVTTITRLNLNSAQLCDRRIRAIDDYLVTNKESPVAAERRLRTESPFIFREVQRQRG